MAAARPGGARDRLEAGLAEGQIVQQGLDERARDVGAIVEPEAHALARALDQGCAHGREPGAVFVLEPCFGIANGHGHHFRAAPIGTAIRTGTVLCVRGARRDAT